MSRLSLYGRQWVVFDAHNKQHREWFAAFQARKSWAHCPVRFIIDDENGVTLVAASSLEKDQRGALKTGATVEAATVIGKLIAQRAAEKGIKDVVFDRGAYIYHGRVKALADGAREGGLNF